MTDEATSAKNWLDDMTILRDRDSMLCHHWMNGGEQCAERLVDVRQVGGGSHRTLADYIRAAEQHFQEAHGIAVSR